jgi:hypothetical protein
MGFGGVAEQLEDPAYASAVGLMLTDVQDSDNYGTHTASPAKAASKKAAEAKGMIAKLLGYFKA